MGAPTTQTLTKERKKQLLSLIKELKVDLILDNRALGTLDEALTHTSAKAEKNHERLEFLGDAVLRLAASEFIEEKFPKMNVGERSELRAQLVSDRWLSQLGKQMQISKLLIIGPKAAGDNCALATLEAEAIEALIGGLYECCNSLSPIHKWLTPHWLETSKDFLKEPHKYNAKSALQEWSQDKGLKLPIYNCEEKNKKHGDPLRFFCQVGLNGKALGEGYGKSKRDAQQAAARHALKEVNE